MAVLLALACSVMWGTSDFLGGWASRRLPILQVYAVGQVFGLLAIGTAAILAGQSGALGGVAMPGIASGLLACVGLLSFYAALASGPMGVVASVASLGAAVPVLIGMGRGEEPGPWRLAGIGVALAGVVLACGPEVRVAGHARPIGLALLAACGFGLSLVTMADGSAQSPLATMTVMRLTTVALAVIAVIALRRSVVPARRDVPLLASTGLLDAGAVTAFGYSASLGMLSVTAVLASLYPVVTVLLAAIVVRERLRGIQYAGIVLALGGVALIASG